MARTNEQSVSPLPDIGSRYLFCYIIAINIYSLINKDSIDLLNHFRL